MSYEILFEVGAERDLKKLTDEMLRRIDLKLDILSSEPRPKGARKLAGLAQSTWRVRVGSYRILYTVDDSLKLIHVLGIQPRPKAYR